MRVLWFTNSPSNYVVEKNPYNGGGWISSLENELKKHGDIDLAISFLMANQPQKKVEDRVTYYPIQFEQYSWKSKFSSKFHINDFSYEKREWSKFFKPMQDVISDFKPDIIEIFGSELPFALIASETKVPVVLHIQGVLVPYWNAFFPPMVSPFLYCIQSLNPKAIFQKVMEIVGFKRSVWREREELARVQNYIARTEWSRRVIHALNPTARFFYGGEILRDVFYEESKRSLPEKLTIISTISQPLYKGFDLILKTAKLLKEQYVLDFEWKVFGNIKPSFVEKQLGICHKDVCVKLEGVANAVQLKQELENATVYAHTAYIENSPNSVCEAQILGIPVIATNVGGVISLIDEGETGYLVPANDPYQMAFFIEQLYENKNLNIEIGGRARKKALERHNKGKIIEDLIQTYRTIIG